MNRKLLEIRHLVWTQHRLAARHPRFISNSAVKDPSFQKAKRSYGQNFLKNVGIAWEIVQGAGLAPGNRVLEIGPGTGVLTEELLKHGSQLTAIENDHDLIEDLQIRFSEDIARGALRLQQGDATRIDLKDLLDQPSSQSNRWKVVANLPFNITTEVLKILLPLGHLISDVHVMLQVEAAQRLSGTTDGTSDYRAMSAFVEFYSKPEPAMHIPRHHFQPQPNVDCQMVNFQLKQEAERPAVPSEQAFLHVLRVAFTSRRKTLYNNLKAVFPAGKVSEALESLNFKPNVRPQDVNAEDFAAISRILSL